MSTLPARTPDATFQQAVELSLRGPILARLEEAIRYAEAHGQQANLASLSDNQRSQLQLTLLDSQGANHVYLIDGDLLGKNIVLEQLYADGTSHRQEITLAGLNETVIETELAAFFSKAVGLKLDYLAERHPAGFW